MEDDDSGGLGAQIQKKLGNRGVKSRQMSNCSQFTVVMSYYCLAAEL